jgi:dienelactone hydrolase
MNRREFLNRSTAATFSLGLSNYLVGESPLKEAVLARNGASGAGAEAIAGTELPETAPLTEQGDLAMRMVDGIRNYLLRETGRQAADRERLWSRDYLSADGYVQSVEPNRQTFRQIIGAVDPRAAVQPPEVMVRFAEHAEVAQGSGYKAYAIRWRVFDPVTADSGGMQAEGLLLEPQQQPVALVVALPDADWTPEMLIGITDGVPSAAQFARRLAENGIQIVVPVLMNRDSTFSGIPGIGMTNMPHREWIYRMAYETGRHIIGYEVQMVLAVVDWFERENFQNKLPIGVMGYGEGGLVALYSAAIDTRIDATAVSGYFQPREALWTEPIYRDLWGLVREFGDAELASLVAPRSLLVEACRGPEVAGPPPATNGRQPFACPNGTLTTPPPEEVRKEVDRAAVFFRKLNSGANLHFVASGDGHGLPGSDAALRTFLQALGLSERLAPAALHPPTPFVSYAPLPRLHRQFDQIVDFTQALIRKSPDVRKAFWKNADASSIAAWKDTTKFYRDYIWDEVIGRMPPPALTPNPRTRLVLDEPAFKGYEVMLDVWSDLFAYGILLVPGNLRPGERRPVVVCQHGLEGHSSDVADPKIDNHFYHHFGASLANEGFVVYAPQNPYIGDDRFRIIQRIGHPLKLALFSFILGQHEQTLKWLTSLPFVDPGRIGFYGLSYGGKTAVRVPPLLDQYALSICSGDFNEWVWKTTNVLAPQSYMLTKEYDMYEFNFANVLNYSDLADLMAPRPFMVERGHDDPVGVDQWVSFEYAFVREFYDKMDLGAQTRLEFFNGPHTIHGVGTIQFLREHLRWPESR